MVDKKPRRIIEAIIGIKNAQGFQDFVIYFAKRYFNYFSAQELHSMIDKIGYRMIRHKEIDECTFYYTENPIKLGLCYLELVRMASNKFKSMTVICMEIESFIYDGITKFVEVLEDEQKM